VAIGPWDPPAASGHMRASDADRDRVVDALKAAYVYGLLTREELAARTGQALAARTYTDLAAVTALLAERHLAAAAPVMNPPAGKRISRKAVVFGAGAVVLPPALAAAFLTFYGGFIILFLVTFIGAVVTAVPITPDRPGPWLS
jgi:hypothetical protein